MKITKDMIVREVVEKFPETVSVFDNFRVDFCCGGAHSIEQTARARGCKDINELIEALNRAVSE
jgi:regulator of cell morphogenesis and NO signaling